MASLSISDLPRNEALSAQTLGDVRGGGNFNFGNMNTAIGGGFASPAIVVAPVIQTDTKVNIPSVLNFGGLQWLKGL
jgi:hypothetical protein